MPSWALAVLRRIGGMLLVVWGAATAAFVAVRLVPGDPVDTMIGIHAQVSEHLKDAIRVELGLDRPAIEQYLLYLGRLATGDLGQSYQLRKPVLTVLGEQFGPTVQLTLAAFVLALGLALLGALLARGPLARAIASTAELVVVAAPTFWTGLLLLSVFGFQLGWFPVIATQRPEALVLPALALALPVGGILSQVLREGIEGAEAQPFMTTVRARGVGPVRALARHSLRHGATGTVALGGYLFGSLLGGAVLVETVFARPGIGRVALRAILDRDTPVLLGIVVLSAVVFCLVNLLVDVVNRALDPRLRTVAAGAVR